MKIKKILLKTIIPVLFIVAFILPIMMMYNLSKQEKKQFKQYDVYDFKETAYGTPCEVERKDIKKYFNFDGVITSNTYEYIEFKQYKNSLIKTVIGVGDEVKVGDVVAYAGKLKITSDYNGIVEEVLSDKEGYIKLRSLDKLKLTCMTSPTIIRKIKDCNSLTLDNGDKVKIDFISNMATDNKVKIVFEIENMDYLYGQEIKNLKIYTGDEYKNVLVVDKNCVYQKKKGGPNYIRVLDENLFFLNEVEVDIGFETEEYVSVVNVREGTFCDSGYKALLKVDEE